MNLYKIMQDFEKNHDVEKIEYDGIKLWAFIKIAIIQKGIVLSRNGDTDGSVPVTKRKKSILQRISGGSFRAFFYGIFYSNLSLLFRHCDSVILADNSSIREVEGKKVDQFLYCLEPYLGKFLPILDIDPDKDRKIYKKYINHHLISDIIIIMAMFKRIDRKLLIGSDILDQIKSELNIEYNFELYISIVVSGIRFYKKLFKRIKPKMVGVVCYYDTKMYAIYAAKTLGIPVFEIQHGIITKSSSWYNTAKNIGINPYPDYLLCYGEYVKKEIGDNGVYKEKNIFPIGSFAIDVFKNNNSISSIAGFTNKYCEENCITVVVIGQRGLDAEIIETVMKASDKDETIKYIYIPRDRMDEINYKDTFFLENEFDVYTAIVASDVTISVSSACIVESIALGTPVVLLNIGGLATYWYGDISKSFESMALIDEDGDIPRAVRKLSNLDQNVIMREGEKLFSNNYQENIRTFFERVLK